MPGAAIPGADTPGAATGGGATATTFFFAHPVMAIAHVTTKTSRRVIGSLTILTSVLVLTVTIVVACRNEIACIRAFVDALARLDRTNLSLDVIIADGMSIDGTRHVVDEFARGHAWCAVIDNPEHIVSTGLNRAIRQARGEFIVRMDAHTIYEPGYVVRSVAVLESTGAANAGGPQRSRAKGYWPRAIHAGFHSPFATGGARFRDDSYCGPVDTVPYGCWRRDYLIAIGLFDETLVRNQDDELNLRIRLAGGAIWQDPSIVSWYSPRATLSGVFRQYFNYGFWRVAVLRKHPGQGALRHFVPAAALLAGICLLLFDRPVLLLLAAVYLALSLAAALQAAHREGWALLPALPVAFAVYQSAYAAGFLCGLVYWTLSGRDRKKHRQNSGRVPGARPHDSA
jgi:succinoglycan biosynthesis protein ExoA